QEILDHFLAIHKAMNYNEFIKFVYNTYPVKNSKKGQYLNIPELVEKELDEEVEEVWEDIIENFDDVMVELAK
ncbi:MAG: hypothetical protein KDK45_22060, partial [Leptospiraceae bacterium]|nr:hypothetical protein [Leptospiraceae bacterium]